MTFIKFCWDRIKRLATEEDGFVWAPYIVMGVISAAGAIGSAVAQKKQAEHGLEKQEEMANKQNTFTMQQYSQDKKMAELQRKDQQRLNAITQFNNVLAQSSQLRGELSRIWGRK